MSSECEDCEERDARIAELEEEVRSVGTIGALYGAEKAKDKIKALKIDYDLCVTDRARIFHRMQAAEDKVKKLRDALEATILHCSHPLIDANWRHYMDNNLRPKLEQALKQTGEK